MTRAALAALATTLMLAACVTEGPVRPAPQPVYNPPPPYEAVRQCAAANRRDHAEVYDLFERARRDSRISPAEAREFSAMDQRLRQYQQALGRDGLTLRECESIGREIARAREAVYRMTRRDSALVQCRRDNERAHADVVRMFADAERAGRITQRERRRFDELQRRFRDYDAALKSNGLTFDECQALGRTIAADAREVRQMAQGR